MQWHCHPREHSHRSRMSKSVSVKAAALASRAQSATDSGMCHCAAGTANEIAARFPVPRPEVADRLVDLLLPREPMQTKEEQVA